MSSFKKFVAVALLSSVALVGCSGGSEPVQPIGEVMTSKAGAEQMKKMGPKVRSAASVPSVSIDGG